MENPLLAFSVLPNFSAIKPELIEPAIRAIISQNRLTLTALLKRKTGFTWENLMQPLEEIHDRLGRVWGPISHLHAVAETEALRASYNACLPLLSEYHTELVQNVELYEAIVSLQNGPEWDTYDAEQQKVISNDVRDFNIAGVNLPTAQKARFGEIQQEMSKLTTLFSEHVLDATHGWFLHVTTDSDLAGLPDQDIQSAAQAAQQKKLPGWVFTLDFPSYSAVMKYLDNRSLREQAYTAYCTRASDQGPDANKWDNTPLIENILALRHELAQLLGFANYADYSLALKMADSPERVLSFLENLVQKSREPALQEMRELKQFAQEQHGIEDFSAWDMAYYSEKLRQAKYAFSQDELKQYFPAPKVLAGMFAVVNKLYGLNVVERKNVDVWHPQVGFYDVFDEAGQLRGSFYTDLYAREHKRDGAWMDECRQRRIMPDGSVQLPVAFLTCNFTRPIGDQPALLTKEEVETVFHEFGHCLHHMMTQINHAAISGINGVAWDAVEFPSQIMEHWCLEKAGLALIAGHVDTGAALPDTLYEKLMAAKHFQSGMQMVRQLEFSLFDFRIHLEFDPATGGHVREILQQIRQQVGVVPYPAFNRFENTFSHIFAGGYAAGYYSYKWAEVLSSDAYSLFEETGIFNRETGKKYLENILEVGGLRDPMTNFVAFRGREPSIDALLRHSGLS